MAQNWQELLAVEFPVRDSRTEAFIETEIIEKLMRAIFLDKLDPEQWCAGTCATQAPPDFSSYGCTCGGKKDVENYNLAVENLDLVKEQVRKEWL